MTSRRFLLAACALATALAAGRTRRIDAVARAGTERLVAAIFYPWYEYPNRHFKSDDGQERQRHHFAAPELVAPDSVAWYERELADLAAAGVDVLLAVNVPPPATRSRWMPALRAALERTRGKLERPVRVALLLDPWFVAIERTGGEGRGPIERLDLTDAAQFAAFLAPLDDFAANFPPELRATLNGKPLIVIGPDHVVGARPEDWAQRVAKHCVEQCGVAPHLVIEQSWQTSGSAAWHEGASLLGAQLVGSGELATASIGPGYDERFLERGANRIRLRERGATYASDWQKVLRAPPPLVLLESWNQLHDGTALCTTLEHGRSYVDATRHWSDVARARAEGDGWKETAIHLRTPDLLLADSYAAERELAALDVAHYLPGEEERGIALAPSQEAALAFERDGDGAPLLIVQPPRDRDRAVVHFVVSAAFADPGPSAYEIAIEGGARDAAVDFEIESLTEISHLTDGSPWLRYRHGGGHLEPRASLEWRALLGMQTFQQTPTRGFDLVVTGGALALRSVALRRLTRALPKSRAGISDGDWFARFCDAPRPTQTNGGREWEALRDQPRRAAELGARWFRFEVDWPRIEPQPGHFEFDRLTDALHLLRAGPIEEQLEPVLAIRGVPDWAKPAAAHPQAVARLVTKLATTLAPELRFLELFPGFNAPSSFARAPDLMGYVRVLRAAAQAAHDANPHLALTLGGLEGIDVTSIGTLEGLRQSCAYDAISIHANDECGELGSPTMRHELARFVDAIRAGGDDEKLLFVELGATTDPSPLASPPLRSLLPELIRSAWKRLGAAAGPVHVFDAPGLPIVRGVRGDDAIELLKQGGLDAVRATSLELKNELTAGRVATLLLPQGEIVAEELLPLLPPFVDRGGLLVTLGGAPFRRSARATTDGGFSLVDDAAAPLALRDDLRIALAHARNEFDLGKTSLAWRAGPLFPELASLANDRLAIGALFSPRTGQPRNDKGYHRYDAMLTAMAGDVELGDAAALLTFTGNRSGALLLIGLDARGGGATAEMQAARLKAGFDAAEAAGARVVFWRQLDDAPGDTSSDGLFTAAGVRKPAAEEFEAAARK